MKAKRQSEKQKIKAKEQLEEEIAALSNRIEEEAPARGYAPPLHQTVAFRALPLSQRTLRGLEDAKTPFTTMTAIQNACIPHALAGKDILGAARTGSGKTLAFLIPVLENLFRDRFTPADGPGAAILSPTRELAVQIFHVLRVVGKHHSFSVGLLIGGKKDFYEEQQCVGTTNIIIATPGRLLQHLEQTPYFDMAELRILVLDEADRILDLGFRDQLVSILGYLPKQSRQTLLFSATQTRDVSTLATLSLHKPEYLGVHDKEKTSTPETLQQSYIVVPLEHKLDAIYSFVKTHLRCKSIIFMASCSQVRYAWELFCSLRPGLPVMALHGKLVQTKRTQIYFDFLQRPHAVLFATDIAARGLDFPNVDWVVQADAPEDKAMYIHRAGRTARYRNVGKSLLILTPSEEKKGFIKLLQGKGGTNVPVKKLSINPTKTVVVTQRAASLVAASVDLNRLAKKAFQSYVRCIYLMPLKEIFDVKDLQLDEFSASLGLASKPNVRFLKDCAQDRSENREKKNVNRKLQKLKEQIKAEKLAKKLAKMGKAALPDNAANKDDGGESEDDLLVSKKKQSWKGDDDHDSDDDSEVGKLGDVGLHEVTQSRRPKKIRIEGANAANQHVKFTDDGEVENFKAFVDDADEKILKDKDALEKATDDYMSKVRERLKANLEQDKTEAKERLRLNHKKRRLKEKAERDGVDQEERVTVSLGGARIDNASSDSDGESSVASASEQSVSSDSSSSDDSEANVKAQEEMALSLIRGTV